MDRATLLREMGITPMWQLRESAEPVGTVAQDEAERDSPTAAQGDAAQRVTPVEARAEATSAARAPVETLEQRAARIASLSWDELVADIAQCTACKLCETRKKTVPGVGNRSPEWVVIGEGPGENEDKEGKPFVGRAGQLLDQMLAAVKKSREKNVFIANVVKCRPPENRDPEADEIAACAPYLERQIALARPKLLLAVGKFAGQTVLQTDATVGAMRAWPGERAGVPVVVTYHPAYLLRAPKEKAKAWEDLVAAKRLTDAS